MPPPASLGLRPEVPLATAEVGKRRDAAKLGPLVVL
jgi:hypothetical protein